MTVQSTYKNSSMFDGYLELVCKFKTSWLRNHLVGKVTSTDGDYVQFTHKNGAVTMVRKDDLTFITPVYHQPEQVI